MIRQVISVCVIVAALMVADRYFVFIIGSTVCGFVSYLCTYKIINSWLKSRTVSDKKQNKQEHSFNKSQVTDIKTSLETPINTVESFTDKRTLECAKFCGTNASLEKELKTFVHNISERYIQVWYHKICQNEDVLQELNDVLEDILTTAYNNITRMNILELTESIIYIYNQHFDNYLQALEMVKSNIGCESLVDCIGMENEIQNAYKNVMPFSLSTVDAFKELSHPAMTNQVTEWCYLKSIVASIIDLLWPQEFLGCQVAYNMLEEILTKNVLFPLIDMFSEPEWLNEMLIILLSDDDFVKKKHFNKRKTLNTKNIDLSETDLTDNRHLHRKWSEIPKGVPQIFFNNSEFSGNLRRHSDSHLGVFQNTFSFPLSDNYLTVSGDVFNSRDSPKRSQNSRNLTVNISSSQDKFSPGSEWEVWSGEFNEYGDIVKIFPHNSFSRIKSQSTQDIDNICVAESSSRNKDKDLESPDSSLKRSQSVDCLSHLTPPLSHVVSLSGSNSNLDEIRTNLSKLVLMNMPTLQRKENSDIEEAIEATETAWSNLFSDIKILETEKQEEPGRGSYILYCIQYNALFAHNNEENNKSQLMKHNMSVKRRFREFLALQGRLEENSKLKKYMKKIKGPNKWLGSLLFPMDKKTVEERRQFLEKYLQELCSCKAIAASSELQEFLAYQGDASIAYVRRTAENVGVPRIDKMLFKGVMGAIDLIKTALPATVQDDTNEKTLLTPNIKNTPHKSSLFLPVFGKLKSDHLHQHMEVKFVDSHEQNLIQKLAQYIENFDINSSEGSLDNESIILDRNVYDYERSESINSSDGPCTFQFGKTYTKSKIFETNSNEENLQENLKFEIPLANAVIDLYLNSLKPSYPLFGNPLIIMGLKIAVGNFLNKYLEENIYDLFKYENCVNYLHLLHLALWPEEEEILCPNDEQLEQSSYKSYRTDALAALRLFLPGILKILNSEMFENSTLLLHDSLQYSQLNRCLIYHILDHLMDYFCARDDVHLQ